MVDTQSQSKTRNIPENRSLHLVDGGTLKSHTNPLTPIVLTNVRFSVIQTEVP